MGKKNLIIRPFVNYPKNPILGTGKSFTSKGVYNPTVIKEKKGEISLCYSGLRLGMG